MINWIKRHLIGEARAWWRMWSVRFNALGLALLGWVTFDPASVLMMWRMMPASLRASIPMTVFEGVALALFALGLIARFVRQPKLEKHRARSEPDTE